MQHGREFQFGHDDRRAIYEYVERHGVADRNEVRDALGLDPTAMRHHVAILVRDGRIESDEEQLRVGIGRGELESAVTDDGTQYAIRPARQEDLSGIVGAIREVVAARSYVEAESVAQVVDHEEVLLRFNEIESRMFFVATVAEEVIGWVHIDGSELEKLSHTAELTLGVLEGYRGQGIGSALLRRGLEWASDRGYERLYQSAPATNEPAIEFLKHHGWEIEAIRADHYRIDGELVDEVMMATGL